MPTPTYVAIAKTVLTGTQATITFSSIPQTYTDLILVASPRSDQAGEIIGMELTLNGSPTQSNTYLYGNGLDTAGSTRPGTVYTPNAVGSAATSNTFGSVEIYFPNYTTSSSINVSITATPENNATTGSLRTAVQAKLIQKTTGITSITLAIQSSLGSFVSGSRFDLYGIKNS